MLTEWRQRDPSGMVVTATTLRLVSLADRNLGLQLVRLEMEHANAEVSVDTRFDEVGAGLDPVRLEQDLGVWRTEQSGKSLAMACTASLQLNDAELSPRALTPFRWSWNWASVPGQAASFQRLIAVARSDSSFGDPGREARDALDRAKQIGWRGVLPEHEAAWAERWRLSDLQIAGDVASEQALRFAIYHLNGAANPADERVSIGARALTGDAYLGHVFWDTEIYALPFYVATWPEAARALLMYRYHTLPGARAKAVRMGWRGAMYAWESTDTGEETTPEQLIGPNGDLMRVLCGTQEQHITADIAYAIWQYWEATGDDRFMVDAGAEILLETARFWASRACPEADGRRHIRGVIGPDEYHENIDDSAYTNVMARWNIRRGVEIAALLRDRWPGRWAELSKQLDLDDAELRRWQEAADTLFIGFTPESGLFEQFAGFFDLEAVDLSRYADRTVPLDVILGRERTQRSQVVKQADIVALLALLPEECDARARLSNFQYYEQRCGHGSSLSRGMHALAGCPPGRDGCCDPLLPGDGGDRSCGYRGRQRRRRPHRGTWRIVAGSGIRFWRLVVARRCSGPGSQSAAYLADAWLPRALAGPSGPDQDRSGSRRDQCRPGYRRANASRLSEDSGTRFSRVTPFAPAIAGTPRTMISAGVDGGTVVWFGHAASFR